LKLVVPSRNGRKEGTDMPIERGDLAPGIDLPDDEGVQWRLSEQTGRSVMVIFHRHLA
jgi:peroxiredoxin